MNGTELPALMTATTCGRAWVWSAHVICMLQRKTPVSLSPKARSDVSAAQCESQAPAVTPVRIVQIGYAFREAKALLSAIEVGVFAVLAGGPLDLEALREKTGLHRRGARDFLDALVALGLLERDAEGFYANSSAADLYLVPRRPTYIGGLLDHLNVHEYPV